MLGCRDGSCLQQHLSQFALHPKESKCLPTSSCLFCQNIWYLDKKQFDPFLQWYICGRPTPSCNLFIR